MTPSSRLDAAFTALADPTRRAILARLALGEATVTELAEPFAMSRPPFQRTSRCGARGLIDTTFRGAPTAVPDRCAATRRRKRMVGRLPPILAGRPAASRNAACRVAEHSEEEARAKEEGKAKMKVSNTTMTQKITPFLWFDGKAEEAAKFYTSIFKGSKIGYVARYGDAGPGPKGSVMTVTFEINGRAVRGVEWRPRISRSHQPYPSCKLRQSG